MIVLSPIGSSGFGMILVKGRRRSPRPPARITAVRKRPLSVDATIANGLPIEVVRALEQIHQPSEQQQLVGEHGLGRPRPELEPVPASLVATITGRDRPLFAPDIEAHRKALVDAVRPARFLVTGGAGSIGASFVRLLAQISPAGLGVIDIDENGLADLVRGLRASPAAITSDFRTAVIAVGSVAFERFFAATGPWDVVLNFAAMKHVRSERDPYSLMRMIETNVFGLEQLCALAEAGRTKRLFSVSSDKAVAPASLMGATKRWMEHVIALPRERLLCSSARFANVAFSQGSLPHAFLDRLAMHQPLAAPNDVRRYFISHQEAAQLCLLSGLLAGHAEVFVPRLDAEHHAIAMDEVARRVLAHHDLTPLVCSDAESALHHSSMNEAYPTAWPCWFSASDTAGEKALEELWTSQEIREDTRFKAITVVHQPAADAARLAEARERVMAIAREPRWCNEALVEAITVAVPELRHHATVISLDDKL
jgi:FlaA1/EpsC-like NDP-sugar epimerase